MREVFWITDYEDEIVSDMSVFHGVRDMDELSSAQWFKWAELIPAYEGAARAMIQKDEQKREDEESNASRAAAIKARMQASAARYEGGKAQAASPENPLMNILNDPAALQRARELAASARDNKDGGVANG